MDLKHFDEALQVLRSDNLGVNSRVAQKDPGMFQDLYLRVLEKSENHSEVASLCRAVMGLEEPDAGERALRRHNPWAESRKAWFTLIGATFNCEQPK